MPPRKKTAAALSAQTDPRAPLDAAAFLAAAQRTVATLRDDLLTRADSAPGVATALHAQWTAEKEAKRTGDEWDIWRRRVVVQIAAAWVLSLVFVRTLEDRGLVDRNRVAGPGATDSQDQFRALAPYLTDRDYLLTIFRELANLPAAADLFDPQHNLVWKLGPSIEGARTLLELFRAPDAETPSFRFGQGDTRFLGDLYQDLDEETRERFALLQTPEFVEKYILDRTLERAIARFGLDEATLIDPTCGSGHFLLSAFERLVDHRLRKEPGLTESEAARKALNAVYGADINPYAVAMTRFRLTLAFLEKGNHRRLEDVPALPLHVVVGDSLLHAPAQGSLGDVVGTTKESWSSKEFALEDEEAAKEVLFRRYAAVVGNPPYITVKDTVLRERYRGMYPLSAAGKYSLGAPFTERFFILARPAGFVGMITANSFMKREFGKRLIELFLPKVNLDGVVNTSGAFIPGHGTPTVLLFGSNEPKQGRAVLSVLAKRGEPSTPGDPNQGLVWRSIADHGDEVGFDNEYISVARVERGTLEKHPWSLGGGGAAELKELLEERKERTLGEIADSIGIASFTLEDDVYLQPSDAWDRLGVSAERQRPMVIGEAIRDWSVSEVPSAFFPYDSALLPLSSEDPDLRALWSYRTNLSNNMLFGGKTKVQGGLHWYEYGRLTTDKLRTPLTITFAFVATHNHFVLDRGGKVFNRSAPIIKLKDDATEEDHLALLAYLNSSTACFFARQVLHSKGAQGINEGHKAEEWEQFLEFSGTQVATFPLPSNWQSLAPLGREMLTFAAARGDTSATAFVSRATRERQSLYGDEATAARANEGRVLRQMVALQERIDFEVYRLFNLLDVAPRIPGEIAPGFRAFEVQVVRDASPTAWFARHQYSLPEPTQPALDEMGLTPEVRLIEQPTFKRRWLLTDWSTQIEAARHVEVIGRCEEIVARRGSAEVIAGRAILQSLAAGGNDELIGPREGSSTLSAWLDSAAVPYLAAYRYTDAGLEKRRAWERVWNLQRAEDRGETVPPFEPPPKYDQKDYRDAIFWRLRGKLDVPKERFISYPGCESDEDKEPVYGWAGWNHLQQAIALATLYMKRKQGEAWGKERLVPMLAGLDELLPWIWQWHPEPTAESGGMKPGQYIADFLAAQCHELGVTVDELRAWRPTARARSTAQPKKAATPRLARPDIPDLNLEATYIVAALAKHAPATPDVLRQRFVLLATPKLLKQHSVPDLKASVAKWTRAVKGRDLAGRFDTAIETLRQMNAIRVDPSTHAVRFDEREFALGDSWWLFEAELATKTAASIAPALAADDSVGREASA